MINNAKLVITLVLVIILTSCGFSSANSAKSKVYEACKTSTPDYAGLEELQYALSDLAKIDQAYSDDLEAVIALRNQSNSNIDASALDSNFKIYFYDAYNKYSALCSSSRPEN